MSHVIMALGVSTRLGVLLQGNRTAVLRVLNRLFEQLENHSQRYRKNRNPIDTDLFDYTHSLYANGRWRRLRFSINDVRAQDYLFVEAVSAD